MREQASKELRLPVLDQQTVTVLMGQVLGRQGIKLLKWQVHELSGWTGSATNGVYRLAGTGLNQDREVEWSLILKVLSRTPAGKAPAGSEQEHVLYWKREALVYQSHLLDNLPGGLRGPRCYDCLEHSDESIWLWLEDVKEHYGPRWPLEQYARAARSLGQMNGAYLAGRSLPSYPWLVRTGSPRGLLEHSGWMWKIVRDPSTWQHPLLRAAFPLPIASRLLELWEERNILLEVFERLPQTFCHLDAWRGNLFAAPQGDGQHQLIAIDWAYPGLGTIATDIGDLFAPSFGLFGVEPCDPRTLDTVIFENYLEGLQAVGWCGDRSMVRYAFAIFAALKYGCFLHWLYQIVNEDRHASWERRTGHSLDECLQNQAALIYYLLDLADEARYLINSV
ncbi:phosphotransferase [Dictyobacter formicarum]|uniref:Aminoglycoside phosphotransferase domain-containing protein n=1 Tax=Dictyobacter formicarum TaxID=2778368 RepID=A0ABQ3VHB2_9CHLR|nr:phosphotransferase [Dictyobacter formicarum]GHO85089.1 hypothetical protein KSZ_30950 [Dictyobacter formicarum]